MEDVNLWSTSLASLQVMTLFEVMASGSSLRSLNIGENSLVSVQATHMAQSLRGVMMRKLDLVKQSHFSIVLCSF